MGTRTLSLLSTHTKHQTQHQTKHQTKPPYPLLNTLPLTRPAQKCLKALWDKDFSALKSYRKATEKKTEKHQTVESQALDEILFSFSVFRKLTPPSPPPAPPVGTIFAGKHLVFSIHFCFTEKLKNKKQKTKKSIERVALACFSVFFSVPFQSLFSFLHFFKKHAITKHPPTAQTLAKIDLTLAYPPCLAPPHSTKQALNPCLYRPTLSLFSLLA